MTTQDRPPPQPVLDMQITQAIRSLRQQGHKNFVQDMEQIKQLAAALAGWNETLMHELDRAMFHNAQARKLLLSKILLAMPAAGPAAGAAPHMLPADGVLDASVMPLSHHFSAAPNRPRFEAEQRPLKTTAAGREPLAS